MNQQYQQEPALSESTRPAAFLRLLLWAPGWVGASIAVSVLSAVLSIAPFGFLYFIVIELSGDTHDTRRVEVLTAWMVGAIACRWAMSALAHVLAHAAAFNIQDRLRRAMAQRLAQVPLSFFSGKGSGSLRKTLTDDVTWLEGYFAHMLPDLVTGIVVPLAATVLLWMADWRLALAAIVPLPIAMLAQFWAMRGGRERMRAWSALQGKIANQVGEYVRGIHIVKSFGQDARSFGHLSVAVEGAVAWVASYAQQSAGGWVLFTGLITANLVWVGACPNFCVNGADFN